MKNKLYKVIAHVLEYVGSKRLVMCCVGMWFETKIPDELRK